MSANIHDLVEYQFSKDAINDLPRIMAIYNKLVPALQQYSAYTGVYHVLTSIQESQYLLAMQYNHYARIHKNKGKIDE